MYRVMLAALFASGLFTIAAAQDMSRYDPTKSSCEAIQNAINDEGAVILRWDDENGLPRYDRFVADVSSCHFNEHTVTTHVTTRDGDCAVRICEPHPSSESDCVDTPNSVPASVESLRVPELLQVRALFNIDPCTGGATPI